MTSENEKKGGRKEGKNGAEIAPSREGKGAKRLFLSVRSGEEEKGIFLPHIHTRQKKKERKNLHAWIKGYSTPLVSFFLSFFLSFLLKFHSSWHDLQCRSIDPGCINE